MFSLLNLNVGKIILPSLWQKPVVLVVEDNASDSLIICDGAEDAGFRTIVAQTAEQALGILNANGRNFAAVTVDIGLPMMDGWTFYLQVVQHWPKLPIWMVSGSDRAFTSMPKGKPITLMLKSTDYHEAFRQLKRQI